MEKFVIDIVMLVGKKDCNKAVNSIAFVLKHLTDVIIDNFYIVTPVKELKNILTSREFIFVEDSSIPFSKEGISFRPGWTWQQLIKLFNTFVKNRYYLCIDSDCFFIKDISLFHERGIPYIFRNMHKYNLHGPYFDFIEKKCGLPVSRDKTYVCDFMLFDKKIIDSLILDLFENRDKAIDTIMKHDASCTFSEYETYGHYAIHKGLVLEKQIQGGMKGKYNEDVTNEEFIDFMNEVKQNDDFTYFSYHTWGS